MNNSVDFNDSIHIATHQLVNLRYIVIDADTGEVLETGTNGEGYETPEEAIRAYECQQHQQ